MDEKNVVQVYKRSFDESYVLTGPEGVGRESFSSCTYVGEFKIKGNPNKIKEKIWGAQELSKYLGWIKSDREEEIENLPNVKSGLEFEIKRIEELREKFKS